MHNRSIVDWPLGKRLAFRFLSVYFILFVLPFPLDYLPFAGFWFERQWMRMWVAIVVRAAKPFLSKPLAMGTAGSSDMTWNVVQLVCIAVLAAIVTLIWSVLARGRSNDERIYPYVHAYLRFYLASAMFSYGIQKVIPAQFPPLVLDRLVQTYGSSSPMGFLWTFMGASPAYEMFTGAAELLAGILLVARRTALLGTLLTIGVMSNVVALNLFFDVSVKTYSSHLLLIAIFLAAPDARRLADFFVRHRPERLFERRSVRIGWLVFLALLVARFVYVGLEDSVPFYRETISPDSRSPLRGVWNVDVLDVDGVPRPPLTTDAVRWRRVVFDLKGRSSIFLMNDDRNLYNAKIDEAKKTISFKNRYTPQDAFVVTYARPDRTTLQLDGTVAGHRTHAVCKLDEKPFLLTSRKFHWINERAVNR